MEGYCWYCHDIASMWCMNVDCDGHRKSVCKECAESQNCRCSNCGERFIDIAEVEDE
jgi:hypothetical protein